MKKVSSFHKELFLRRLMVAGFVVIPLGIAIAIGFFICRSDKLRIASIEVSGNISVSSDEIISESKKIAEESFFGKVLGGSHVFAWKSFSDKKLSEKIFRLADISSALKTNAGEFQINVSERKEEAVWCLDPLAEGEPKKCFWMDESGNLFAEGPDAEGALIRVINDRTGRSLNIKDKPLSESEMENFKKISSLLSEFGWIASDIALTEESLKELKIKLPLGQEIYFSLSTNPLFGEAIIKSLMESGEWPRVKYLDIRVDGKGFYKLN